MPIARLAASLSVALTRVAIAAVVPFALLPLVAVPAVAAAQPRPGETGPAVDVMGPAARPPVEIGATMGVALIVPTFGGTLSMPIARRASVELVGQVAPWMLESGDDTWFMTQVQLRVPFRERPRARRSLIVGLTSFTVGDRYPRANGRRDWDFGSWVRPHAGVSWQWQRWPHIDMRLDVHAVFLGDVAPLAAPVFTFSTIWHRERGAS
jgi:hypothetical protein